MTATAKPETHRQSGRAAEQNDLRFRALVPPPAWAALAPAIRKRFTKHLPAGTSALYQGKTLHTRMNLFGFALAHTLRLLGAPLPLARCTGGYAAIVTVTQAQNGTGQFWTRQYNREKGFPQIIHSTKSFAGPTGLEECIGYGIGMTLRVDAQKTHLNFISERYYITLFGTRFYLPAFLAPGHLTVGHHDMGNGQFDFTLELTHSLFGELIHQRARFSDTEQAA